MFTKKITESDAFLDMPASSQMLYFHLNMSADDDGFVNNPRKVQRMCGASDDDFKLLLMKSFILSFDSGIIVIKHWKMHNYIQSDRYKSTDYIDEKSMLKLKKNKAYSLCEGTQEAAVLPDVSNMDTECIQNVSVGKDRLGKDRLGKDRLGKDRLGKDRLGKDINTSVGKSPTESGRFVPPTVAEVEAYCIERNNGIDAEEFVDFYSSKGWYVGKNKMKDWKAAIRTWEKSAKKKPTTYPTQRRSQLDEWADA